MDFEFTEEEQMWQRAVRENVERYLAPGFKERWNHQGGFDRDILKIIRQMDMNGYGWDEKYGGKGELTPVMRGIAAYEIARGDVSFYIWGGMQENAEVMQKLCSQQILDEWAPSLAAGETYVTYLFVEPGKGSDLGALETTATYDEANDEWTITGDKASVTACDADAYIVAARTELEEPGAYGISLFFVPRDTPGCSWTVYEDFGLKEVGRGDVALRNVKVPGYCLMGERGKGFKDIMHIFDCGRPMIACTCIGAADVVMEQAVPYCEQRMIFGRPLSTYEGISFKMAEHRIALDQAKMTAYKALKQREDGKWNAPEAGAAKWSGVWASIRSIWFCTTTFGHLGYTSEYDALYRLADVMGFYWGDGALEICEMVKARDTFGDDWLPYKRARKHPKPKFVNW